MKPRVLFLLKIRKNSKNPYWCGNSSGLYNSVMFLVDLLNRCGIESKLYEVVDNNHIDKAVNEYKPTHCVIEALWVVPEKFEILSRLHPNVKWIIRVHSNIPFLSMEGMSFKWLFDYIKYKNTFVAFNNLEIYRSFKYLITKKYNYNNILYLPNYYEVDENKTINWKEFINSLNPKKYWEYVNVGCFGAIRPLKNQAIQAIAAIKFSNIIKKKLRFHINIGRIEGFNSESILKNIRNLFNNFDDCFLIEHSWLERKDFIKLVKSMDIGLQVSMSETFNIISADFINNDIPIIGSEIDWLYSKYSVKTTSVNDIIEKMLFVYKNRNVEICKNKLKLFCIKSNYIWLKYLLYNENKEI